MRIVSSSHAPLLIVLTLFVAPAHATNVIPVTTPLDLVDPSDAFVSLREAMETARSDGDHSIIVLDLPEHVLDRCGPGEDQNLTGDLDHHVFEDLTIVGIGTNPSAIVAGCDPGSLLHVTGASTLELINLRLEGGRVAPNPLGGTASLQAGGATLAAGEIRIEQVEAVDNIGNSAGAFQVSATRILTVEGLLLESNSTNSPTAPSATTDAGGMSVLASEISLSDVTARDNEGTAGALTLHVLGGHRLTLHDVDARENRGSFASAILALLDTPVGQVGTLEAHGLNVVGNRATASTTGAACILSGPSVSLRDGEVGSNLGAVTGAQLAILAQDEASLSGMHVHHNESTALFVEASRIELVESTVGRNLGDAMLAAATLFGGERVLVQRSTIHHNSNTMGPGGLFVRADDAVLESVTLTGNRGTQTSGLFADSEDLAVYYSTLTNNDGNLESTADFTSYATVIGLASNGTANCVGAARFLGSSNYDDDTSCGFSGTTSVSGGPNPLLQPLRDHGGPVQTRRPRNGSPLRNVISSQSAVCTGQAANGAPRPLGGACDIGAHERN